MPRKLTTEEFIAKANNIHNYKYDYTSTIYNGMTEEIVYVCSTHGEVRQSAHSHIKTSGCPKCSNERVGLKRRTEVKDFISKANKEHKNKYTYSKVVYKTTDTKVIITCNTHGDFLQTPHSHLLGQGCPECGNKKLSFINKGKPTSWRYSEWEKAGKVSDNFDGFSLYIIECFSKYTGERFIKIGKTFVGVSKRFNSKERMPYAYKVITQIYHNAYAISVLENKIHKELKEFKVEVSKSFAGESECFDIKCLKEAVLLAEGYK